MRIHYCKGPNPNFGDELNAWLWQELLPNHIKKCPETILVGIGTIINDNVPEKGLKMVFGSGVGYAPLPKHVASSSWRFYCVRGPVSAAVLGIDNDFAVTDGAILLRLVDKFQVIPPEARIGISFMPHVSSSLSGRWSEVCKIAGINYLDPKRDSRELIREISSSKLLLAEAMHGAIVADTFRVPWIPVVTTNEISTLKWLDWTSSMEIRYKPSIIGGSCLFERLRSAKRSLLGQRLHSIAFFDANEFIAKLSGTENAMISEYNNTVDRRMRSRGNALEELYNNIAPLISAAKKYTITIGAVRGCFDNIVARMSAKELRDTAKRSPYLSAENVFNDRLGRMEKAFYMLKNDLDQCVS